MGKNAKYKIGETVRFEHDGFKYTGKIQDVRKRYKKAPFVYKINNIYDIPERCIEELKP